MKNTTCSEENTEEHVHSIKSDDKVNTYVTTPQSENWKTVTDLGSPAQGPALFLPFVPHTGDSSPDLWKCFSHFSS